MSDQKKRQKPRSAAERYRDWIVRNPGTVLCGVFVVSILFGLAPLLLTLASNSFDGGTLRVMTPAEFGGMYGFLAAVVSGLAFAALVIAVAMQSQELELQRQELKLTRRELKRSAAAQETTGSLAFVSAYLSAVSTAVQHHNALRSVELDPTFEGDHSRQQEIRAKSAEAADHYMNTLESLISVLARHAKENVPDTHLPLLVEEVHKAVVSLRWAWSYEPDDEPEEGAGVGSHRVFVEPTAVSVATAAQQLADQLEWTKGEGMPAKAMVLQLAGYAKALRQKAMRGEDLESEWMRFNRWYDQQFSKRFPAGGSEGTPGKS